MSAEIPSIPPADPGPITSQSDRFRPGDRVVLTYIDQEHLGTVASLSQIPGMRSVNVRFDEPDEDGNTVGACDPRDLRHVEPLVELERTGGGPVQITGPSQADQWRRDADPTDPAHVGEVPPITPDDIPDLYAVSADTMVRPPDSARHRASSQAGLQAMRYALDATHQALSSPERVPSLTAIDEAETRGFQLACDRAVEILGQFADKAVAKGDDDGAALLADVEIALLELRDGGGTR
jgi:hypothetical protein